MCGGPLLRTKSAQAIGTALALQQSEDIRPSIVVSYLDHLLAEHNTCSGMYWPATVLNEDEDEDTVRLEYDNGDIETVSTENLQPSNPPVDFGEESKPLQVSLLAMHTSICAPLCSALSLNLITVLVSVMQVGEFVEIFNNSTTDPAAWVGLLTKIDKKGYTVSWPSH